MTNSKDFDQRTNESELREQRFRQDLAKEIVRDYQLSLKQAEIIVNQAWNGESSCRYGEIVGFAYDMVNEFRRLSRSRRV